MSSADDGRWLRFEIAGTAFAIPLRDVLEVAEVAPVARVPGLPAAAGGVMNLHGDALPVLARSAFFEVAVAEQEAPQHILVLADRAGEVPRLGLPVDRVLGLVVERPAADALDAERLFARAVEVVARASERASGVPERGRET
jgi:chemotaxis signal transduction protein